MRCPFCGQGRTEVRTSRERGAATLRQRRCTYEGCSKSFETEEIPLVARFQVVKKDGRREEWSMDKFLASLKAAFPYKDQMMYERRLRTIVEAADAGMRASKDRQRPSSWIGDLAIRRLANISETASIRYASVYYNYSIAEIREQLSARVAANNLEQVDGL